MKPHKPSSPFPNGSAYDYFEHNFCNRCKHGEGNCDIADAIIVAMFDETAWPADKIVETDHAYHVCTKFESDDKDLMAQYHRLFDPKEATS